LLQSITSASGASIFGAMSAINPLVINTSAVTSRPDAGSITRPPFSRMSRTGHLPDESFARVGATEHQI
jgi:hypothetical protein